MFYFAVFCQIDKIILCFQYHKIQSQKALVSSMYLFFYIARFYLPYSLFILSKSLLARSIVNLQIKLGNWVFKMTKLTVISAVIHRALQETSMRQCSYFVWIHITDDFLGFMTSFSEEKSRATKKDTYKKYLLMIIFVSK